MHWSTAAFSFKNFLKSHDSNCAEYIGLTEGLVYLQSLQKQFHIFSDYRVCLQCSQAESLGKTFHGFSGIVY